MSNASNEPTSIYTEPQAGGLIDYHQILIYLIFLLGVFVVYVLPDLLK